MTDDVAQFVLGKIHEAWEEEVLEMGGDPERPTPDEEKLLLFRELQILPPEIVYGKETWEAIKDMDTFEGEAD
jgi:hypothetical protein